MTENTSAAPFGGRASTAAGFHPRYVHFVDLLFPLGVSPLGFGFALHPPIAQAPLGSGGFCGVAKLSLSSSSLRRRTRRAGASPVRDFTLGFGAYGA